MSNRISFIQSNTNVSNWRYVRSEKNPADLISRGMLGKELVNNIFWFEGPKCLKQRIIAEPSLNLVNDIPELRKNAKVLLEDIILESYRS